MVDGLGRAKADGLCVRRSEQMCTTNVNAVNVRLRYILKVFYYSLAERNQSLTADLPPTRIASPTSRRLV